MCCRGSLCAAWTLALLLPFAAAVRAADDAPLVAPFSAASPGLALPAGWSRTDIKGVARRTSYALVDDGGTTVLRADADRAASAVVYKVSVAADAHPVLRWRWKISRVIAASDPLTKEGDDYPARIYVVFDYPLSRLALADRLRLELARAFYDPQVPAAALCYVWDARLPAGTVLESPYTSRVRIIVVESGGEQAGEWTSVERDVAADFRRAYGEEPPPVSAVALATDTDNTGDRVTAWYGDIVLKKRTVISSARDCGATQDCFLVPLKQK